MSLITESKKMIVDGKFVEANSLHYLRSARNVQASYCKVTSMLTKIGVDAVVELPLSPPIPINSYVLYGIIRATTDITGGGNLRIGTVASADLTTSTGIAQTLFNLTTEAVLFGPVNAATGVALIRTTAEQDHVKLYNVTTVYTAGAADIWIFYYCPDASPVNQGTSSLDSRAF